MRVLTALAVLAITTVPASASLINGDFENGTTGWSGHIELNSLIHGPGPGPVGSNKGSNQTGGGVGTYEMYQIVTGLNPALLYSLDGFIAGGTLDAAADLRVILAGDTTDQLVANLPDIYSFGWTPYTLSAFPTAGGDLRVSYEIAILGGWSNGTAIHADGLTLIPIPIPEPSSLALLALAGLPLLRRLRTRKRMRKRCENGTGPILAR